MLGTSASRVIFIEVPKYGFRFLLYDGIGLNAEDLLVMHIHRQNTLPQQNMLSVNCL